ncbi:MAG: tagaturonate epimerase family protein [Spirochaetales bacterium]
MAEHSFGKLRLDPAKNPAVLDTTTWDRDAAISMAFQEEENFWIQVEKLSGNNLAPPLKGRYITIYPSSHAPDKGGDVFLGSYPDGQDLFIRLGPMQGTSLLGYPLATKPLSGNRTLSLYPTDMEVLARYLKELNPEKAPKALGTVPRLGIGDRHTVFVWPAALRAMEKGGIASNMIQNSLRELNLLEDLKEGLPAQENYLFSFGTIAEGHTGSTFEGLLHAGVLAVLKDSTFPKYGADADHIQVKRGPKGLDRAKKVMEAARHYTFFTLDVSDILGYSAFLEASDSKSLEYLTQQIPDEREQRDILLYHRRYRNLAGVPYAPDQATIGRLVGKYWKALEALEQLCAHLRSLKGTEPFDLELSIDENPPEVSTCACITRPEEVVFLALEIERRHLPVTHLAPNFGVEKSTDYRCPDGPSGLEKRVRQISQIASLYNLMLDCHSGDDLSKETRKVFGRATRGRINFKISPMLQLIFAETLYQVHPALFKVWWQEVYQFVQGEAKKGSSFAKDCLQEVQTDPTPHPSRKLFHYYCFVPVGKRDEQNRFILRDKLYDVSEDFQKTYAERLEQWFLEIAEDLYSRR